MKSSFVHLHLHSEYSLVNGTIKLPALIEQTLQQQNPAVALTDMGNLYGAVKFFRKCVAQGIKPIIGAEVFLDNPDKVNQPFVLVLLVQTKMVIPIFPNSSHWVIKKARAMIGPSCARSGWRSTVMVLFASRVA